MSVFKIVYDYCDPDIDGVDEVNQEYHFVGSWDELQKYIQVMRRIGCYNIEAVDITEQVMNQDCDHPIPCRYFSPEGEIK